jgi:hypothetical protein
MHGAHPCPSTYPSDTLSTTLAPDSVLSRTQYKGLPTVTRQYVPTTVKVQPCPAEVHDDEHDEDGKLLNNGYPSSVIVHDKSPTISK